MNVVEDGKGISKGTASANVFCQNKLGIFEDEKENTGL